MNAKKLIEQVVAGKDPVDVILSAVQEDKTSSTLSVKEFLGTPEIIHGMKYGGTRYKYNHGIFIDFIEADEEFQVYQAGHPSKLLGKASTLEDAKKIALDKAEQVPGDTW